MKLSSDGHWHAFFYEWGSMPRDLCQLIRRAIFYPFWLTVGGVVLGCALGALLVGTVHLIGLLFGMRVPYGEFWLGVMIMSAVAWVIAVILAAIGLAATWNDSRSPRPDGIIKVAYQGFKEKYCPLIEWEPDP